jgi:hypothetical protein
MRFEVGERLVTGEGGRKSWQWFDAVSVTGIGTGSIGGKKGMTTEWAPAQLSFDMEGRRIFDTALGILIGLRRCSSDAAFQELLDAAQRHGFPAFPMAWALVHLAGGGPESAHSFSAAQSAARREWGQHFAP